MKSFYLHIIFTIVYTTNVIAQHSISGKVTDLLTKDPLSLVNIYFPDLKRGTASDQNGNFKIDHLPEGKYLLLLKHLGYTSIVIKIEANGETIMNFQMEPAVTEYDDIVVTGVSAATEHNENPIPTEAISKENLNQNSSNNIIDAIANTPGVSQITTGTGISKPVIRGLTGNRILVLQNGVRMEGQQWGEEHGIEVDEYAIDHVEIIKGPGSIMYGSDAMGGVINLQPSFTPEIGKINNEVYSNYQSNNNLFGYSFMNTGNVNGFHWLVRGGQKKAGNYSNAFDGKVFNSGSDEKNFNGTIGLIKKWGYANLYFSSFNQTIGLPTGERNYVGRFLRDYVANDSFINQIPASEKELLGYFIFNPKQIIEHTRAHGEFSRILGRFRVNLDYVTDFNRRKEFETYIPSQAINPMNRSTEPDSAAINLGLLHSFLQFKLFLPEIRGFESSVGSGIFYTSNSIGGREFIIPPYRQLGVWGFIFLKKSIGKFHFSGGLRWDTQKLNTSGIVLDTLGYVVSQKTFSSVEKFQGFTSNFGNWSSSMGASFIINKKNTLKINLARGFRAPNISELSSNGHHHGTERYETGDTFLKSETNFQLDAGYVLNSEHITFEISTFRNSINNFIFSQKLESVQGGDSLVIDEEDGEKLTVFKYIQSNSMLFGGEASLDLHPHPFDWLHFENTFSIVMGEQNEKSGVVRNLPLMPEPKYIFELHAQFTNTGDRFKNFFLKTEWEYHFSQNRYYSLNNTETSTAGYPLWHSSTGCDIVNNKGGRIFQLYFSVHNILDASYQNHLNRLKYMGINPATGRIGIYNMGRNFSIKFIFPLEIKLKEIGN